jgi:FMN-dependent NADH-azoreductase
MPHLLHLDSSIRTDDSRSRALSAHYAAAWKAANPDGTVTYRDLAADPIPHLDHDAFYGNFVSAEDRSPEQAQARALAEQVAGEVLEADEIVIGMGLYNFGAPSTVKSWFDRIVVPGLTAGVEGGALSGKKLTVTAARGGGYGPGAPREGWDHREPWLIHAFEQLGLTDTRFIHAELTLARESPAMIPMNLGEAEDKSLTAAHAAVEELFATAGVLAADEG